MNRNLVLKTSLLFAGILLGVFHALMAASILFIGGRLSLFFALFLISGPVCTLPAVIAAFLSPRIGIRWLIVASISSGLMLISDCLGNLRENFSPDMMQLLIVVFPLALLGFLNIKLARNQGALHDNTR